MASAVIAMIWTTAQDLYDFIYIYDGIGFYQEYPWVLAICVAGAMVIALVIHFIQRYLKYHRSKT